MTKAGDRMRFDLADLSLFRHVVEAGSITHGAERAHLALAAASTRIRNMEEALGAPLLVRGAPGRHADPGRPHAAAACPDHAARRPSGCARTSAPMRGGLAGQIRVLSNTNALTEFLPEALSSFLAAHPQRQRRPRGAAERRDRRPDRRRRRRHRHRRRHRRCRRARDLSVPQATASCWWWRTTIRSPSAPKIAFAEVLDHDFVGLDRASALQRFLADKAARIGRPLRLRVQLRSFDAVCRLVECNVGIGIVPETTARRVAKTMAIRPVALTDPWAVRELTICIRDFERCRRLRANSSSTCGRTADQVPPARNSIRQRELLFRGAVCHGEKSCVFEN